MKLPAWLARLLGRKTPPPTPAPPKLRPRGYVRQDGRIHHFHRPPGPPQA